MLWCYDGQKHHSRLGSKKYGWWHWPFLFHFPPCPCPFLPSLSHPSHAAVKKLLEAAQFIELHVGLGWGHASPHPSITWSSAKSMGDNLANPKMKRQHCSSPCYDAMMVKNITAGWEANVWLITLRKQQLWEYKRLQGKAEALVTHLMVQSKHKKKLIL